MTPQLNVALRMPPPDRHNAVRPDFTTLQQFRNR
jgi:hypothetical protein